MSLPLNAKVDRVALSQDLLDLEQQIRSKIEAGQSGVPTLRDNAVLRAILQLRSAGDVDDGRTSRGAREFIAQYLSLSRAPRFSPLSKRRSSNTVSGKYTLRSSHIAWSQGAVACLTWRQMPLFKTCYDFAIYPMLISEVKPRTIIEIGSGTGASGIWFADLLDAAGLNGAVYSVDIRAPRYADPRVKWLIGDCRKIEACLMEDLLKAAPKPWIFIEDANVNTIGVFEYIRPFLQEGDYLIFEDSCAKVSVLDLIADDYDLDFLVDTRFTDFYGHNLTSSQDAILVRSRRDAQLFNGA